MDLLFSLHYKLYKNYYTKSNLNIQLSNWINQLYYIDRCINGMFVFAILVHVLNRISKSARDNCVWPP